MNAYRQLLNTRQFKSALAHAEQEVYIEAYKYTDFNQSATARLLGISRTTLISRLKEWDSQVHSYV